MSSNAEFPPIVEDDASMRSFLESANLPALMASIVHLTGSADILREGPRPGPAVARATQSPFSKADQERIRSRALEVLVAYRDRGGTLPPPPSEETIRELMSFVVGVPVPAEYIPMMQEEMRLDADDARRLSWEHLPTKARQNLRVLVIGAGMSGLLSAIRLQEEGISYDVVEKNESVGGTWLENSYPGCRVDVPNHFYCYSFEPNADWSEFYSQAPELRAYFEACATKYEVRPHIRFCTEVVSARWMTGEAFWEVRLRNGDGAESIERYQAIISGVGQLNRPRLPEIPGRESFAGMAFHSARWPSDLDLAGKRVAVVGTGASALQIVPEIAKEAREVHVFQRSPAWMSPNPNYHRKVSEGKKWLLRYVPFYANWYRFLLFWPASDGLMPSLIVDPQWPHPERSVSALNDQIRIGFTEYIRSQLADDPELFDKVLPTYPPFIKRMLQDNGSWLSALKKEHVHLVTEPIAGITTGGISLENGDSCPVDVIVFATGFHANRFLWPMEIVGDGEETLAARWGDEPSAYLGITVEGFPNLFCLYGPGTNLAHAGSIIFHSECQVRYVMGCLKLLLEKQAGAMECRPEVAREFEQRHQEAANRTVWVHPGARSWYKNERGRLTTVSPFLLVDYWRWTREPDPEDFHFY